MADEFMSSRGLSVSRGGGGEPLVVLLHGLGANRAVWQRMIAVADKHWPGRWMAPDLRGHGRSLCEGPYGYAMHAADIAELIRDEPGDNVTLAGHSFGGVVAAMTGTGWFGPQVKDVAAFGVKIAWTPDEEAKAHELAQRPARVFATRAEAIDRFLKSSGLFGLADAASDTAASGVAGSEGHWQVAMDPRCFGAVGPSIERILRLSVAPLRLAAGAGDPMVTLAQMRAIDQAAWTFTGAAHNAHWETPELVWDFIVNRT
ncbi:MAG: alpha/beta hydrolase [Pseudolabrys sp.]|nr:alpha/beta hydrolase [Pseudolabrys sp.]MDP2296222.1 alpha/beta hydrolase [Pseudolabrys sp.]